MKTEEKLQQAAKKYSYTAKYIECKDLFYDTIWLDGAKSPESLEYWKEKEKLYSEEEVKRLTLIAMEYAQDNIHEFPYEYHNKWFELNKK